MSLTFDQYQEAAARTDLAPGAGDPVVVLLGLAGQVGGLIDAFSKNKRADGNYSGFDEDVSAQLGSILWYLATVARRTGLDLEEIARANLVSADSRWLPPRSDRPTFDADLPDELRLPERFEVTFESRDGRMNTIIGGRVLGDTLVDNGPREDHFRFHDAFHLSYATVLGWSPIMRFLVARDHDMDEVLDPVEDSPRARAIEEAILALVFRMAEPFGYFEDQERVDGSILAAVESLASTYRVKDRSKAEWERAILTGFAVWRRLRSDGGGRVAVDLAAGTIEFVPGQSPGVSS